MNLPGVSDIGDLTAFQRMVLIESVRLMNEEEQAHIEEAQDGQNAPGGHGHTPNAARRPGGGGKRVETKSYRNKAAVTGKDPEELIAEYRAEHGLDD